MTWEQMERAFEFLRNRAAKRDTQIQAMAMVLGRNTERIRRLESLAESRARRLAHIEGEA